MCDDMEKYQNRGFILCYTMYMTTFTDEQLEALLAVAEAAPPGHEPVPTRRAVDRKGICDGCADVKHLVGDWAEAWLCSECDTDAQFVAAFDPLTAAALVTEIVRLREAYAAEIRRHDETGDELSAECDRLAADLDAAETERDCLRGERDRAEESIDRFRLAAIQASDQRDRLAAQVAELGKDLERERNAVFEHSNQAYAQGRQVTAVQIASERDDALARLSALEAGIRELADEWHDRAYSGETILDGMFNECEVELRSLLLGDTGSGSDHA